MTSPSPIRFKGLMMVALFVGVTSSVLYNSLTREYLMVESSDDDLIYFDDDDDVTDDDGVTDDYDDDDVNGAAAQRSSQPVTIFVAISKLF